LVLNARDARWFAMPGRGRTPFFEGDGELGFPQLGIGPHVLMPGEPNGLYHREGGQEDFLVIAGECLLLVEGQERRLRAWDFVHCPPGTQHIFVGAGDGPCVILMAGARGHGGLHYPASAVARRHGASAERDTDSPAEAYAPFEPGRLVPYQEGDLPEL
jgi:uncharacterized cupin superfamily protein